MLQHLVCDVPFVSLASPPAFPIAVLTIPSPLVGNIPPVIPGTSTRQEQLLQCRRWLGNERRIGRFTREAIVEVEMLFHKDPAIRATHPFDELSLEAKQIVATVETEREEAAAGGTTAEDWWHGPERKGATGSEQKAFKEEREWAKAAVMVEALEKGEKEEAMLGLGVEEEGLGDIGAMNTVEEAAGLGAMTAEDMGLGPGGFDDLGFVSCDDDDLAEDEQQVGEGAEKGGEMEGVEEGKGDDMAMDLD